MFWGERIPHCNGFDGASYGNCVDCAPCGATALTGLPMVMALTSLPMEWQCSWHPPVVIELMLPFMAMWWSWCCPLWQCCWWHPQCCNDVTATPPLWYNSASRGNNINSASSGNYVDGAPHWAMMLTTVPVVQQRSQSPKATMLMVLPVFDGIDGILHGMTALVALWQRCWWCTLWRQGWGCPLWQRMQGHSCHKEGKVTTCGYGSEGTPVARGARALQSQWRRILVIFVLYFSVKYFCKNNFLVTLKVI